MGTAQTRDGLGARTHEVELSEGVDGDDRVESESVGSNGDNLLALQGTDANVKEEKRGEGRSEKSAQRDWVSEKRDCPDKQDSLRTAKGGEEDGRTSFPTEAVLVEAGRDMVGKEERRGGGEKEVGGRRKGWPGRLRLWVRSGPCARSAADESERARDLYPVSTTLRSHPPLNLRPWPPLLLLLPPPSRPRTLLPRRSVCRSCPAEDPLSLTRGDAS